MPEGGLCARERQVKKVESFLNDGHEPSRRDGDSAFWYPVFQTSRDRRGWRVSGRAIRGDAAGTAAAALRLLPPDIGQQLLSEQGSAPTSSSASKQHPDRKIEDFYECCIRPFVPSDIQQSIDNVEWDGIGPLLSQACHKLELRKPGEDRHLRDLLGGMFVRDPDRHSITSSA